MKDGTVTHVPTWAIVAWSILILSLIGSGLWVFLWSQAEDERRYRIALAVRSDRPAWQLRDCLAAQRVKGLSLVRKGGTWLELPNTGVMRAENAARHLRVDVIENDFGSLARFYTREGKPLRPYEVENVNHCLSAPL